MREREADGGLKKPKNPVGTHGNTVPDHFVDATKMVSLGSGDRRFPSDRKPLIDEENNRLPEQIPENFRIPVTHFKKMNIRFTLRISQSGACI